jgi:hypothetical protein
LLISSQVFTGSLKDRRYFALSSTDIVKGLKMDIRKIAVVGGFAVAAALTSAPLASADDLTAIVDSEIASLNSTFETEAAIAGDSADVVTGGTGVLDTIPATDAPDVAPLTTLDYELYGPWADSLIGVDNPISAAPYLDPEPGAQDVFNGALVEFDDAYNTVASLLVGDEDVPVTDLIGAADQALDALGTDADPALFATFVQTGVDDILAVFFAVPLDSLP